MYYPYLRARQFELIALRELVEEKRLNKSIIPILEPIKELFNNINYAHDVFVKHSFHPFFIVNPIVGEVKGDTNNFLDKLASLENNHFHTAFHFCDNAKYINESIRKYELQNCLLISFEEYTNEEEFKTLCNNESITHIMILNPNKNRILDGYIKKLGKKYIRLDDVFQKQAKNADFLSVKAHRFTEEHLYYLQDNYQGFSDFTTLTSEYNENGGTPRAVVIHLSYINNLKNNEIWIRHFTSETGSNLTSNVQGKFAEAAKKAIKFCDENKIDNSAIFELKKYYNNQKYPGLGTVKKISIKNHLLIVEDFLIDSIS